MPGSTSATVRWRKIVAPFAVLAMLLVHLVAAVQPVYAASTELFFSEYIEGSSNNKALEIYNGTSVPINLATGGYSVQMFSNGNTAPSVTINLSGTVASGDVFVLAHGSAVQAIRDTANQTNSSGWFNGNDAVVLRKGDTRIDVMARSASIPDPERSGARASPARPTIPFAARAA